MTIREQSTVLIGQSAKMAEQIVELAEKKKLSIPIYQAAERAVVLSMQMAFGAIAGMMSSPAKQLEFQPKLQASIDRNAEVIKEIEVFKDK